MKRFRADLHIHTVLSPCADLEMTPANIIKKAKENHLQVVGITDHNSTRNAKLVREIGRSEGIYVLMGAEVTTKEEVHCLAFFQTEEELNNFQEYIELNITKIPNPDGHFGYQPIVDKNDAVLELVSYFLPAALKSGISDIQKKVTQLNGIFIPAHIDRPVNGIFSQLGFIPKDLKFDALGISKNSSENHARKHYVLENNISVICNSDAHFLTQIGEVFWTFFMNEASFYEIKSALNQLGNRKVEICENNL